ncbi:hypothetical protein [Streptomyces litchfieldiae]|uniref:Uncharacterized protein n=1 Tax=Streptomyces litchfieldiae TaxID=3075543 RepID=A0ABU2MXJ5_9ACTN|nr:hypothetical protein [Streptomyces sp. DSM 44938]MDT0346216.1 hypothetical protein [Streptomyces sp. DSM 44938]
MTLEVIFYFSLVLLGPLAVRVCRSAANRRARVVRCAGGCLVLFAVPLGWLAFARYVLEVPHTDWPVYFGPWARFGGFAVGMGLAVLTVALGGRGRLAGHPAAVLAAASVAGLYLMSLTFEAGERGVHVLPPGFGGAVGAVAVLHGPHRAPGALARPAAGPLAHARRADQLQPVHLARADHAPVAPDGAAARREPGRLLGRDGHRAGGVHPGRGGELLAHRIPGRAAGPPPGLPTPRHPRRR